VYLLSNLPVDVEVDRLVTLKELTKGPSRLEQAASRGLAVPLSASELHRCFPDLWRTPKAAEHDLNTPVSPIETLLGKAGYLKSSYGFQRLKQLRWRSSPAQRLQSASDIPCGRPGRRSPLLSLGRYAAAGPLRRTACGGPPVRRSPPLGREAHRRERPSAPAAG